jgi:hypothetical protein
MGGAVPPLPQYVFMAWCLVKHRGNFTLYLQNFACETSKKTRKEIAEIIRPYGVMDVANCVIE